MSEAEYYKNRWTAYKCHYGYYGSSYNLFSANCPVDIYIYDTDGLTVTSIVNDKLVEWREDIVVSIADGKKSFSYPTDKDYTVKIMAREDGTMNYSVAVVKDTEILSDVKSYNIPLEANQEFTVNAPTADTESTYEDYQLETNGTLVEADYTDDNKCEEHSFGEWINGNETKTRKCGNCGYVEYATVCDHSKYEAILAYSVVPTCQNSGHSIYVCSGCGIQVSDGEDIAALECDYIAENFTADCVGTAYTKYTCVYCNDFYYEGATTEQINSAQHNYEETVIKPDCHNKGCTMHTCTVCGDYYIDSVTDVVHSYESSVHLPTCTEKGYTTYTCTVCKDEYIDNRTEVTEHNFTVETVNNGCLEDVLIIHTCSCGYSYTQIIAASGHDFDGSVCKNCGYDKADECDCKCHKTGFSSFIWKIINFFNKIFKIKQYCDCGAVHY